jgi:PAS domain S-box-containing protein
MSLIPLSAAGGGETVMKLRFRAYVLLGIALLTVAVAGGAALMIVRIRPEHALQYLVVSVTGSAAVALGVLLYTAHVRAEARHSEAVYRKVAEQSQEGICIVDEQARFTFVNPRFAEMLQYPPQGLVGRSARDLVDPHEHGAFDARFEARRQGMAESRTEVSLLRRDGGVLHAVSTSTTLYEKDHLTGVLCRISDRESEARRALDLAAHLATANEEVQTFTYSVSHDLRAPLRAIDGFARELQLDTDSRLSARSTDYVQRIRSAATRMRAIVDALLDLSTASRKPLRRENVDLSNVARLAASELHDPARKMIFDIQSHITASGDPHLLRIVLDNLIGNAVKFTSRTADPRISFGIASETDGVPVYCVRDNGVGFDPRYAATLFTPFHRLHSSVDFEGSGIGLATVQRIIQRHGGRVWAEGSTGAGATFYFTLSDRPSARPSGQPEWRA